jgi:hypothetical protein
LPERQPGLRGRIAADGLIEREGLRILACISQPALAKHRDEFVG